MSFWSDKRVVVTGGAGFIGNHTVQALKDEGCRSIFVVRSRDYDLTQEANVIRLYEDTRPDIVIHLAGLVGGILANKERPAEFFFQNITMGTFVIHQAWRYGVKKVVSAAAGCGYPEFAPIPLKESSFWDGFPQDASFPYSLAKRMLHIQSLAYYRQYGFVSVVTIPGNVYGSHDNFDLNASHVVPALVRKFVDAILNGEKEVVVWGTGQPSRDFVHGSDVARGILLAGEKCDEPELFNISSGVETKIKELVELTAELSGFRGKIAWDTTRPDGQMRRLFDISKAREKLGFRPQVSLRDGLRETIDWYRKNRASARLVA
jgi:GDP-L-fucose synthase